MPMLPAELGRRQAFLRLLQNPDDLLFAMPRATHFMSLLFLVFGLTFYVVDVLGSTSGPGAR